jgi:DNA-directed RNA polymerase specialized sigma24 family protein
MAGPLNRLYYHVSDRWASWLAVRQCIRLARAELTEFDELTSQAISSPESCGRLSAEILENAGTRLIADDELAVAIAELSIEQRLVLHLFRQGATYREIAAALRLSDECALREIKVVLCSLADRLFPPGDQ